MVKLSPNEEKVRKILLKHPHGVRASTIASEGFMSRSPMYKALDQLETKSLAFRGGHSLWFPENPLRPDIDLTLNATNNGKKIEKSSNQNERMGFFGWWANRAEQKEKQRQQRIKLKEFRAAFILARHELRVNKEGKVTRDELLDLEKKLKEHYGLD